ncbi:C40 family peptidase [Turicimonas muris]|uniref:NlpC/P60 domain-containing protein n=2 Tax=Turicimonas muris TaxID=1796652 RepID=A0A227KAP9_9BURK|nr:C40 family peptidase [Turicimonas muris]ANU65731.1 hypothetical protein A4V04_04360 [Burkholderiales bacterium YL45]OXE44560.1 hypothetical protein ADH67_11810 [Turicimonas muris]
MHEVLSKSYQQKVLCIARLVILSLLFLLQAGCSIFNSSTISGYVPVEYDGTPGSNVLETAMSQIGKKYSYGKASPSQGFDCSGLIYWAYQSHGIAVPRRTQDQSKAGIRIKKADAKLGDIVVFKIGRRLHTGLVADKGRFLHAPSSGSHVRLESMNGVYWKPRVVGFRRIIY